MDDITREEFHKFQGWMNRHLVSLVLIYWHLDEKGKPVGDPKVAACSGTVMALGEQWFLATAGHVLEELDKLVAHPRVKIHENFIVDSLGSQAKHLENLPFNYAECIRHYVYEDGLDYGLICLTSNDRRLMEVNDIIAIGTENWLNQNLDRCKGFVLLGIPAELVDTNKRPPQIKIGTIIASVRRLSELPPGAETTHFDRFIGDLGPNVDLKSLEGCSGGPIVGFFDDEGVTKYWIVALQSMSVGTRYILGCPVKLFGGILLEQFRRFIEELEQQEEK